MFIDLMVGKTQQGRYAGWSKDAAHRNEARTHNTFRDIWPTDADPNSDMDEEPRRPGPLPWRLRKAERNELNARMALPLATLRRSTAL